MPTKVIGIECGFSSSVVEIPYNDKSDIEIGCEIIFKDSEGKEEYGVIKYLNRDAVDEPVVSFGSKILRKATPNDIQKVENYGSSAVCALEKCKELIASLSLNMNVFKATYSFDGSRVYFMFTADDRIDFRELVKQLAKILQKQIHLKQIGPRDKATLTGGFGKCGRPLCCSTWLGKLESINMEMVRLQSLESKGSAKLSGSCGKLLCCLKYEVEAYRDLRNNLPKIGAFVRLKKKNAVLGQQEATIVALDILNQKVKVVFPNRDFITVVVEDIEKILKNPASESLPYDNSVPGNEPPAEEI